MHRKIHKQTGETQNVGCLLSQRGASMWPAPAYGLLIWILWRDAEQRGERSQWDSLQFSILIPTSSSLSHSRSFRLTDQSIFLSRPDRLSRLHTPGAPCVGCVCGLLRLLFHLVMDDQQLTALQLEDILDTKFLLSDDWQLNRCRIPRWGEQILILTS